MSDHTVKAFDADLANLARMVTELHEQVEKEIKDAVEALIRNDDRLMKAVLVLDESNVTKSRDVETNVILLIARRQPVAHDLRFIVAIWETAIELNRASGVARSIVNRAMTLGKIHLVPQAAGGLRQMTGIALRRLREVVNSLVLADTAKIEGLPRPDNEVDSVYSSVCRELLTYMMSDPRTSSSVIQLLFSAKSIESIGENVTNIAEAVHYFTDGRRVIRAAESPVDGPMSH